jgi:hypothetical protein
MKILALLEIIQRKNGQSNVGTMLVQKPNQYEIRPKKKKEKEKSKFQQNKKIYN